MDKPHIILLGDRTKAARWVGYARGQFDQQVKKYGPNFQTAIAPRDDTHIDMRMFGGVRKVIITVQPPKGARFVFTPADLAHYGGWGEPYESEDEFGNPQPVTLKGIPYGTEFSHTKKELIVGGDRSGLWRAKRLPEYQRNYPDLKCGTMDWISSDLKNSISWDGTNSKHRYVVPNEDDVFHGYFEGTCESSLNEGLMFIGQVFTKNPLCTTPDKPFPSGVYRILGINEGAAQTINGYEYEFALSSNVYKDGEILWTDANGRYVTGAAVVSRTGVDGGRYKEVRAIVCDYNFNTGAHKDYLVRYNLTAETIISEQVLGEYGNEAIALLDINRSVILPWANVNAATFRGDGRRVLLLRDFFEYDGLSWTVVTKVTEYVLEGDVVDNQLSGVSLIQDSESSLTSTVLWDHSTTESAPRITDIEDTQELGQMIYKATIEGDYVVAVDYDGIDVVYAYVNTIQSDEYTQTVIDGTCDTYRQVQDTIKYEYLWFSKTPEKRIPLLDKYVRRDTTININNTPDMTYRKTFFRWTISEVCGVDAKYSSAMLNTSVSNSWWQIRTANSNSTEILIKYEPFEAITQDFTVRAYLNGEEIYESEPDRTVISYLYSGGTVGSYPCQVVLSQHDFYDLGTMGYTETASQPISHQHAQLVARKINSTTVDILMVQRGSSYAYPPLAEMVRYNIVDNTIVKRQGLNEIAQIGLYFNYDDDTQTSLAYVGNIGLL